MLDNPLRISRARKAQNARKQRLKGEKERKKLGLPSRDEVAEKGLWTLKPEEAKYVCPVLVSGKHSYLRVDKVQFAHTPASFMDGIYV